MRRAAVAVLAGLLVLAGCSSPDPAAEPPEPAPTSSSAPDPLRYVALGDSFTAAPLVPAIDGTSGACVRSTGNYPALVADALRADSPPVRLADRSCVEARTEALFAPQVVGEQDQRVPPQTRPLDRRTDLVTVGIGGNDALTSLVGTCPGLGDADPAGSPCADLLGDELFASLESLRGDLADALRRVARSAPRAEVLLVGYPQTAPAAGTCPDLLPLADGDVAYARSVADALDETLRAAAGDAGVGFVDVYAASDGHDICADEPWVNGATTDPGAALAFHPFPASQAAVADLVLDAVAAD